MRKMPGDRIALGARRKARTAAKAKALARAATRRCLPGIASRPIVCKRALTLAESGPGKAELFLVKLALFNANALANPQAFQAHVQAALRDL